MSKTCSQCNETKPLSDFKAHKPSKDGHYWRCRPCEAAYQHEWYQKNREAHIAKAKEVNGRRKEEWKERSFQLMLSRSCKDCGETNPVLLEFDHLGDKKHEISKLICSTYAWEVVESEMAKCDVRCANCHRFITAKRGNFFKYRRALELGLI